MKWKKNEKKNVSLVNIPCSFKIDDNDLSKKKGGKPTLRIASLGHALHVWLNGEYLGKIENHQWAYNILMWCENLQNFDLINEFVQETDMVAMKRRVSFFKSQFL